MEPGALGFLVVVGMGIVLFFLLRNMNKQFRKIGPKPEEAEIESAAMEALAARRRAKAGATVLAGSVVLPDGTIRADDEAQADQARQAIDAVQTGDAEQDARARGAAKRK
ncbi:MAG TPA: hypothetical protein VK817_08550 [Trebonia sp.]|nr:hypothetical protein [Trebonia sp.]